MKRTLVLVALLLLSLTSLAWAEGAPAAAPSPANGGRCVLPDLSRLSPDQAAAAAIQAGLQVSPATTATTVPACPTEFQCSSLAGCGSSMVCNVNPIGQCCTLGPAVLCCSGTMWVERCPCKCVGEDCSPQCRLSTQVTRSCS
jgi:hypothetical protein